MSKTHFQAFIIAGGVPKATYFRCLLKSKFLSPSQDLPEPLPRIIINVEGGGLNIGVFLESIPMVFCTLKFENHC